MADRHTTIRASQLRNFSITAEDIAANSITGDKLVDGTISGAKLVIGTIAETSLDISNDPVDGYYLKYTTASGMEWAVVTDSGGGASDHGELDGLSDDDHTQYLLADGTRTLTGELTISGSGIDLEHTTTDATGIIFKAGARFIHNFKHPTGSGAVPAGQNTFIGENAGNFTMGSTATATTHGSYSVAVGHSALQDNTIGHSNSAVGNFSLQSNTTSYYNSAIGLSSLRSNTTGMANSAVGVDSLRSNTEGYYNSAIGFNSGRYISGGVNTNIISNSSVYLGVNTKALASGDTNEIVIGYDATGIGSHSVVLGNDSITKTALKGNVGINTTDPGAKLDVDGDLILEAGVAVNEFSTDTTLSGNSDTAVPTEKAVKAYVDGLFGGLGSITHAVIKTGTYTGDGSTSKAITGVGFEPKFVWIWPHAIVDVSYGGSYADFWKMDQMQTEFSGYDSGSARGILDNRLISLDSDGFTVDDDTLDAHPNKNTVVYDYMAIGEATSLVMEDAYEAVSTVAEIETGTYTGDGSTSKVVSLVDSDLTPKAIWIYENIDSDSDATARSVWFWSAEMAPDKCIRHTSTGAHATRLNSIIAAAKGSFTVDDDSLDYNPNKNGQAYDYIAIGHKTITAFASANAPPYVKVSDVKAAGTAGGTFTSGAWRTRTLNTEDNDADNICSLSSNQVTLAAGTYEVEGWATVFDVGNHQTRLYNVTGSTVLIIGTNEYADDTYNGANASRISGRFTIAAGQALELQHRCLLTKADVGFGGGTAFGIDNVFSYLVFRKVA